MEKKKIVYIERDEEGGIAICKDYHHGCVVQVFSYVDQLQPNEKGIVVSIKTTQIVKKYVCHTTSELRDQVIKAIQEAKQYYAGIKKKRESIDGILNDFYSQHKKINE